MAFASEEIISVFNRIKPPYNVNSASQELALGALANIGQINNWTRLIVKEREKLARSLSGFDFVVKIFPSDANFILMKTTDPKKIYNYLLENGIIVRDKSSTTLCEGCLRLTVGTPDENIVLIEILKKYRA
jgi:histidinol-phosphate aminotransferase